MKKLLVNGITLAMAATVLTACSHNKVNEEETKVAYQGLYEIFTDGTCELKNGERSNSNLLLRVDPVEQTPAYSGKLPAFINTIVPWMSTSSRVNKDGLRLTFDNPTPVKADDGTMVQINVLVDMKPHPERADRMLVTQFNIVKNSDGKEENRDFVQWYLDQLPAEQKANLNGLCAIDVKGLDKPRPSLKMFNKALEVN